MLPEGLIGLGGGPGGGPAVRGSFPGADAVNHRVIEDGISLLTEVGKAVRQDS